MRKLLIPFTVFGVAIFMSFLAGYSRGTHTHFTDETIAYCVYAVLFILVGIIVLPRANR